MAPRPPGSLDVHELGRLVGTGEIDTIIVAFPDFYGRLMGKRMDAGFVAGRLEDPVHACDYLLTVDMEMEPIPGYDYSGWDGGYGDLALHPDLSTLRVLTWLDRTAFVMGDACDHHGQPVPVAPRSILRRQVDRAAALGFTVMAGSELEYYLYRTSFEDAAGQDFRDLSTAGWYIEDYHLLQGSRTEDLNGSFRRHLASSGVPVESTKGEWGKGQHELNVRFCEVVEMADRHLLVKQCIKEVADQRGASATFMAKADEHAAGSSSHLHVSLWDAERGTNAFAGDQDLAGVPCNDTFRWFLGGWMAHTAELAACFAPTVNSYKRYQAQSWAPTALSWSPDNRTAGLRVVGEGNALRIENRLPGADVNPYLAYAAAIAAGLDGVENQIEPPDPFIGDVYADEDIPTLPATLRDGLRAFESSTMARAAFGDVVVDHYSHFLRTEADAYDRAVTDWERARYFERI